MKEDERMATVLRFGAFELDLETGKLRKSGTLVHLSPQTFDVLALLASRRGEVVTPEEIREQIWGENTFVDYEQSLRVAIKKIRAALGDDSQSPRYIETLSRRGYRFIASIDVRERHSRQLGFEMIAWKGRYPHSILWRRFGLAAAGLASAVALLIALNPAKLRDQILGKSSLHIGSIAVLPLENLSGDPAQQYFADGMTEELITDLGKIKALRVISRTTAMRYQNTGKTLPEIARELDVDAIVEGTVSRFGKRVRITANLLYAPADRHVWSETYERDLDDVLVLQDEVARAIANEVRVNVTPQEQIKLSSTHPVKPEAYRLCLRGRYTFFHSKSAAETDRSIQLFQQAIEKEPGYALAHAGLAESYCDLVYFGGALPKVAFPKAKAAARRALELDASLAEAHSALGYVLYSWDWDWRVAETELKRAIDLNPNYARAHELYAVMQSAMGHHEQAISEIKLAQELDPLSLDMLYQGANIYAAAHRYDEAIEQAREALALDSNFAEAHHALGMIYILKGRPKAAVTEFETQARLGMPQSLGIEALVYAAVGRRNKVRRMLGRVRELERRGEMSPFAMVQLYVALGDKKAALDWLEKAYDRHDPHMDMVKINPFLAPLRSDPRFQDLLHRMNFPE